MQGVIQRLNSSTQEPQGETEISRHNRIPIELSADNPRLVALASEQLRLLERQPGRARQLLRELGAFAPVLRELSSTFPLLEDRAGQSFTRVPKVWVEALAVTRVLGKLPAVAPFVRYLLDQELHPITTTRDRHGTIHEMIEIAAAPDRSLIGSSGTKPGMHLDRDLCSLLRFQYCLAHLCLQFGLLTAIPEKLRTRVLHFEEGDTFSLSTLRQGDIVSFNTKLLTGEVSLAPFTNELCVLTKDNIYALSHHEQAESSRLPAPICAQELTSSEGRILLLHISNITMTPHDIHERLCDRATQWSIWRCSQFLLHTQAQQLFTSPKEQAEGVVKYAYPRRNGTYEITFKRNAPDKPLVADVIAEPPLEPGLPGIKYHRHAVHPLEFARLLESLCYRMSL